jgi:O-antigen ligase
MQSTVVKTENIDAKPSLNDLTKILRSDGVVLLFFLNMVFVILGYGLATITDGNSVALLNIIKSTLLFVSLIYVLLKKGAVNIYKVIPSLPFVLVFSFASILFCLFNPKWFSSFNRLLVFIIPFFYVLITVSYLVKRYNVFNTVIIFHFLLFISYCIPPLSYYFTSKNLAATNLYGYNEELGQAFYSNHYGWSAVIFIFSSLFLYHHLRLRISAKLLIGLMSMFSLFILLISSSRSSLVSFVLGMLVYIFRVKQGNKMVKVLMVVFAVISAVYFLSDSDSAVSLALRRTDEQSEEGDDRLAISTYMIEIFRDNLVYILFGVGYFNYEFIEGITHVSTYHNSYLEVLFGAGLPLFLLFLYFMILIPLKRYISYYSQFTLMFFPLIIIPFFESNLTAGQFLFFPWFFFILLLNSRKKSL